MKKTRHGEGETLHEKNRNKHARTPALSVLLCLLMVALLCVPAAAYGAVSADQFTCERLKLEPDEPMTQETMMTVLYEALGKPKAQGTAAGQLAALKERGVFKGLALFDRVRCLVHSVQ